MEQLHTAGFENPTFFDSVPTEAFIIHCNCLLRTPAERLDKLLRYDAIHPGSTFKLADEYLPEIFSPAHHRAAHDGLTEFAGLLGALPVSGRCLPMIPTAWLQRFFDEVETHRRSIVSTSRAPFDTADSLWWLVFLPRFFWRPLSELLSTLGLRGVGMRLWNYIVVTSA